MDHYTSTAVFLVLLTWFVPSSCLDIPSFTMDTHHVTKRSCTKMVIMSEDWIFNGRLVFENPAHCNSSTIIIYADYSDTQRLMFYFDSFENGENNGTCTDSYLQVFDASYANQDKTLSGLPHRLCGRNPPSGVFTTTQNYLTLTFASNKSRTFSNSMSKWMITFTAFHTGLCHSYEHTCANKRCIFHSLNCGGHDPCGDNSDCQISIPAIASIALGGLSALGVCVLVLYVIKQNVDTTFAVDRERQPRTFSPAKALENVKSFTPATVSFVPLQHRWSYK